MEKDHFTAHDSSSETLPALSAGDENENFPAHSIRGDQLKDIEQLGKKLWSQISATKNFTEKYGSNFENPGVVHCYLFTRQPRKNVLAFEAFANVQSASTKNEELVYHPMFEDLIERYTKSRAKPNPLLKSTRSTDFCYRLTVLIEAEPQRNWSLGPKLGLFLEYSVLRHVWESFKLDIDALSCEPDLLMGIPMPFEFVNVSGYSDYSLTSQQDAFHRDLHGNTISLDKLLVPGTNDTVSSSLSYLSIESLGPTLQYLMELLRLERKVMSISSALKILDQLLCRLMVLHKYGVILGNLDNKFLQFGVREACNVLYISRFDCATVAPTDNQSAKPYSNRCASLSTLRQQVPHFVNDIESAFYIFLSLIFPILPWDDSRAENESSSKNSQDTSNSNRTNYLDEKTNFWSSSSWFHRMLRRVVMEFDDEVYCGFTTHLLSMLYVRAHEIITQNSSIPHAKHMTEVMIPGTPSNNIYSSLRRIIALYFRFERLSSMNQYSLRATKLLSLLEEEPVDRRTVWNLNDWCWNIFYPNYARQNRVVVMSVML